MDKEISSILNTPVSLLTVDKMAGVLMKLHLRMNDTETVGEYLARTSGPKPMKANLLRF